MNLQSRSFIDDWLLRAVYLAGFTVICDFSEQLVINLIDERHLVKSDRFYVAGWVVESSGIVRLTGCVLLVKSIGTFMR